MYASYDELTVRYPLLKTWGDASAAQISSHLIYYAGIELNGLMASHFSVPFSGNHPTIVDLNIELAYYRAIAQANPDEAEDVKERVLGRIKDMKEGKEYIYTGSGTMIAPSGGDLTVWSSNEDYPPTMSMLDPESVYSGVSSDRLDAEENERS